MGYAPGIVKALKAGSYEGRERAALAAILKPGDRVLEVGSAIGVVGMSAARIVGAENVVAYEANAELVQHAKFNYAINNLPISVNHAILKNAVTWGGFGEIEKFYIHEQFWASSTVNKPGTIAITEVPTLCFERESRGFGANVLICDIEGGEIDLLQSADLTGYSDILMEVHNWAGRKEINKLVRKIILDGYCLNLDLSGQAIACFHRGLVPRQ
jgi:FkbM family methyltransferase